MVYEETLALFTGRGEDIGTLSEDGPGRIVENTGGGKRTGSRYGSVEYGM
jgi:hypothetical protein